MSTNGKIATIQIRGENGEVIESLDLERGEGTWEPDAEGKPMFVPSGMTRGALILMRIGMTKVEGNK
jgi:hypothetical protein